MTQKSVCFGCSFNPRFQRGVSCGSTEDQCERERKKAILEIRARATKKKNKVAYTTVTVTMDRMYSRNLLKREIEKGKGGLKYMYEAKVSREELANKISKKFVSFLKATFGEPSIAYLKKNI